VRNKSPRQATLCFLTKEDEVLLAMKKRGFGQGKWNGIGGKVGEGESVREAAVREVEEEIKVAVNTLKKVATLDFYFQDTPHWNQQVIVFLIDKWIGEPSETEEMAPSWFKKNAIPYDKMWVDDIHWLPRVLSGKKLQAEFLFDGNENILDQNIKVK